MLNNSFFKGFNRKKGKKKPCYIPNGCGASATLEKNELTRMVNVHFYTIMTITNPNCKWGILMKTEKLNIFLDESGKRSNRISLIGAISIPSAYYNSPEIQALNQKLRRKDITMHFTNYNKRDYSLYENIFQKILQIPDQVQFNLFLYQSSIYLRHPLLGHHTDDMLYQKLPERVIYGLFRASSNLELLQAKDFLENSSDYAKRNLAVN